MFQRLDPAAFDGRLEAEVEAADGLTGGQALMRGSDTPLLTPSELGLEHLVEKPMRRQLGFANWLSPYAIACRATTSTILLSI
ncbi:MAG TPA: hypothetical protein VEC57_15595 [Candidatus Limnocylindrales bacterium]|nr:hypothetical protein [Candidatus Limnocylindrales bacterium]